jgi:hypothetical protein
MEEISDSPPPVTTDKPSSSRSKERVSFLQSDRKKSSKNLLLETASGNDLKSNLLVKRLYTNVSPRHQPYFSVQLEPIVSSNGVATSKVKLFSIIFFSNLICSKLLKKKGNSC